MKAYLERLAAVPLFRDCTRHELEAVAHTVDEVRISPGRELITEGTAGREAFIVEEGRARVVKGGEDVATLGPGAYFGELALISSGPRTATVVAETEMTVLVLGARQFATLLEEVPALSRKLLRTTAQRLREAEAKLSAAEATVQ